MVQLSAENYVNQICGGYLLISRNVSKYLRGLAILIVIASHYSEWMYVEPAFPVLRHCISTWGPPGVDIFFLLSGYGLYKSFKAAGRIDGKFILRRVLAVYLPYLLLFLLLEIYHGEAFYRDLSGIVNFLTAGEFWFLNVMFVMYAAFIICFAFFKKAALPAMVIMGVAHTVWLYMSGHADFWTLSNHAFVLGVLAAAGEKRFSHLYTKRNELIVMLTGLAGAVIAFVIMHRLGGSGRAESYVAELVMNAFITMAVLGAAYLLPDTKMAVLSVIGEASLFIYVLHTTMFYAIIFKLESLGYAWGTVITGTITLLCALVLFKLYSLIQRKVLKYPIKKHEKTRSVKIQLHNTDNDAAA